MVKAVETVVRREMGKLRTTLKEDGARLETRVGGLETQLGGVGERIEGDLRIVKNVVTSLDDHAGRTSEARLRERAVGE